MITLKPWRQAARDSRSKSRIAGLATTAALMASGYVEERNALAPLNAVSHIAWGDSAYEQETFSVKYSLVGLMLSASSVGSWAALHEWLCGHAQDEGEIAWPLIGGALVSGMAYVFDYKLAPRFFGRLVPGFEKKVSNRAMLFIYVVLALALGLSGKRKSV